MFSSKYCAELLPGDFLDHHAEHIEAEAVIPHGSRLVQQRQLREVVHEFLAGHGRAGGRAASRIELVHGGVAARAIDQPGRVHHQVAQRDRLLRRHLAGDRSPLASSSATSIWANFGKYFDSGSSISSCAALMQLQRRERDHRLGHRGDVEDRVLGHRDAGGLVAEAEGLEVDELALAGDRDHGAGQAAVLDIGIDRPSRSGQAARSTCRPSSALPRGSGSPFVAFIVGPWACAEKQ